MFKSQLYFYNFLNFTPNDNVHLTQNKIMFLNLSLSFNLLLPQKYLFL